MDDETKKKIREQNEAMGQKIGVGYPGRLPHTLPEKPVFDADPFGSKTKPIDPKCYPDALNPNIVQTKKEE